MTTEVARRLITGLRAGGTRLLFGVPGGGPNLQKVGAAAEQGIPFVLCHTETAACIAASTYGLLTDSVGAALVTRGPGVASAANGVAQATVDKQPLVLIGDTVPGPDRSWVGHQEFDQPALMRPLTKWSGTVGHTHTARASKSAVRLATAHPQGAVHLDMDSAVPGEVPPDPPPLPLEHTVPQAVQELARRAQYPDTDRGYRRSSLDPRGETVGDRDRLPGSYHLSRQGSDRRDHPGVRRAFHQLPSRGASSTAK